MKLTGTVVRGKGQARQLGYPTANIEYTAETAPEAGVWTCYVETNGQTFDGLAVIDMWKLDSGLPSLEVHILDVSKDFYGARLDVALKEKLRDLLPFIDIPSLIAQIEKDVIKARVLLQDSPPSVVLSETR